MTLVIDLPSEIESKAREAAHAEGLEVSAFLREAAEARLRLFDPTGPLTEADLLMRLNQSGFPEAFWNRFRALAAKSHTEALTPEEQQELVWHTEQTENRDAQRLPYLFQLAEQRGITVQTLMTQLGLSGAVRLNGNPCRNKAACRRAGRKLLRIPPVFL